MTEVALLDVDDGVALITLNRPEKLNALNYALVDRLLELLDLIEVDPGIRAVILTGAGDRAFSAGADISEFSGSVRQGAVYGYPNFSSLRGRPWGPSGTISADTLQLADAILGEAKVAFVPGEAFGTPGYARFSFAMADADMEEGIRRIHQWVTA